MTPTKWRGLLAERGIKVHPAAAMFPLLAETAPDELRELASDIKKNGIQQPIVLGTSTKFPGREAKAQFLLDGRNRLDALELAFAGDPARLAERLDDALYIGEAPAARLIGGEVDPWDFVISANLHRRHLTIEDRKRLAAALLKARPERSNRAVARIVKLSPTTLGTVRETLEKTGDVSKMDTRTDTSGRQQPATKPPQMPGKEAWRREMREGAAATTETRAGATTPASARLRATIATLHYMVSQAESIDLATAGQELASDDLADARRKVSRCREWIEKVDAALRVGR